MVRLGCNIDGNLNEAKFSEPMPWIGVYVATASALCGLGMAVDAIHGFRRRKFWFPCKWFSLNATSLTLIAVAIKFSVDLNTSMPRRQDQLAKLSSAALICTIMGNSMPSIGTMENKDLLMNIMALAILVITLVVNICIQLGTGVIYVFWIEHALIMFLMLVLLVMISFSALTVPTIKQYLEVKYSKKHKLATKEALDECHRSIAAKLKEDLMKYWVMAHTSSPQFVMGRSVTCTASGAFCLLAAATLAFAMARSYFSPHSFKFCSGESDYKWSTTLVLITQTISVAVGTIAPAFRWFIAIHFRCPKKTSIVMPKPDFKVEGYWIHMLVEIKECPLSFRIHSRHYRRLAHDTKIRFIESCIIVQNGIVLVSKVIRLVSIFLVSYCLSFGVLIMKLKPNNTISNNELDSESKGGLKRDFSRFVLHLEGEEALAEVMMRNNCDATDHWIRMGKKKQPKFLLKLLEKFPPSQGFKGVGDFDSHQVPSLDFTEPPNCWALPIVTLTSIIIALPNIDHHLMKKMLHSVNEGLGYVKFIEDNLDDNEDTMNIRKTAEVTWLGVDLYHKWLDVDLRKMGAKGKTPKEILNELSGFAKERFMKCKTNTMAGCSKEDSSNWPVKALAANSMYRVCQTMLLKYQRGNYQTCEAFFGGLCGIISDILGACFRNLECAIAKQCHIAIEEREASVREAVFLLGKIDKILKILDQQADCGMDLGNIASIDEQRVVIKKKNDEKTPFTSSDLYVCVE